MKRSEIKPGMRLQSTSRADSLWSPITVTEMTDGGLRFKLDEPKVLFARTGSFVTGGELYTHGGMLHGYEVEPPRFDI